MHCNLMQPDATQSQSASLRTPTPTAVFCVFTAHTLRYAVTLNFDPVTLTFELRPWTVIVYRLWRDETTYQNWAQSSNPRSSYCDLSIWHYDVENVSGVALCCAILFTNFNLTEAIRSRNVTISGYLYIMSRYDLDIWLVDLESLLYILCHVVIVFSIFDRNRRKRGTLIHDMAHFTRQISGGGAFSPVVSQRCVDRTSSNFKETHSERRVNNFFQNSHILPVSTRVRLTVNWCRKWNCNVAERSVLSAMSALTGGDF